jgi:hypothetical protein
VENISNAVEHIYPLVSQFQMEKRETAKSLKQKGQQSQSHNHLHRNGFASKAKAGASNCDENEDFDDEMEDEEEVYGSESDESFDSDVSHD